MTGALRFAVSAALIGTLLVGAATAALGDTIIVKGAWASASDPTTPLPEGGRWAGGGYQNDYFGLTVRFSERWQAGLEGPPPSDSGAYLLAQIVPAGSFKAGRPGHLLITAQDLFFTSTQAGSALELVDFTRDHLDPSVYRVEEAPWEMLIGQRAFIRFGYLSPTAGMHWTVLATEVRCHVVEFVFVSSNPQKMAELLRLMSTIALPPAAAEAPLCIRDYASADNLLEREEPLLAEPRYNPVPVRIIIDPQGKVRHIHFLRAFPDQARAITDALMQWRFRPHLVNGKPVEVETGIVFGRRTPSAAAVDSHGRPPLLYN